MAKLLGAIVGLAFTLAVNAAFEVDPMPPTGGTNIVFSRPIIVTSNWFFAAGYVASPNRSQVEKAFVYARPRPGATQPAQWISPPEASQEFGNSMVFRDGILVIKDGGDTHFFREQNGQWVPDGKIAMGDKYLERAGPVAMSYSFLISGSEAYRWPSREYITTFAPTNMVTRNFTARAATVAGSQAVITFPGQGVWSFPFEYDRGVFLPGELVPEPDGATDVEFGATLANWEGRELLVGAPFDNFKGAHAGAVHRYLTFASSRTWVHQQKIVTGQGMAGDQFGTQIASDFRRLYIAAPYRNEDHQQAGAIFVYEFGPSRLIPPWLQTERVKVPDGADFARLGLGLAVFNRRIYATSANDIVALRSPIKVTMYSFNDTMSIYLPTSDPYGALETSADLNSGWGEATAEQFDSYFQMPVRRTEPMRFFRVSIPPPF